ncbi:MAG: hypothetical protein HXY35_05330 [Chloroflexi bacterium]|nr:hypothetical protein [Chloroflexota bacterium]
MAKLRLNAAFTSASGKLDTLVLRRAHNGQMTLIKLADMSKVKWSKAQKDHRLRFKQAVAYAKAAMAEPAARAQYEKEAAKKRNALSIWRSRIISKTGIYWQNKTKTSRKFETFGT